MKEQDYIYAIYEEKSFSAAAKKLFVSQPALSQTVKKVESELGITIFDRSSVPIVLTDQGRVYIDAVTEMRSTERSMRDRLSDMTDLKIGTVTVSGENFVSSFILPKVIMRYSELHGGIDVKLVESNSPNLRTLLLTEETDLLVAHDFDKSLYESIPLFDERVLLAVPKLFPVNSNIKEYALTAEDVINGNYRKKKPVDLKIFKNEEFLILNQGNDMRGRAVALCEEAGFEPKTRIFLDQLITTYNLSNAGMGISFVTDILVESSPADNCVFYNIDSKNAERTMTIGYKKNRYLTHAARAFIDTAVELFKDRA